MKKILSFVIMLFLILNISLTNAFATIQKPINITVNGTYVPRTDVEPFIEDGRTLVPVRAVAETMGANVLWDSITQTVTLNKLCDKITYQDKEYKNCTTSAVLVIGKKEITITLTDENGLQIFSVAREMDTSTKTINSRTFIPARFVGYALGYDVTWEDKPNLASKVIYKFTGKQTIDFSLSSENYYDPVKRIDYEYDKVKYPDTIVVNDIEYPCRKGYDDIIIVDATNGRFEGTKMINVFPYKWTANNIIIECDDEQYKIDENKTIDENLEAYYKFYTDKVGEKIIIEGRSYYPELITYENVGVFRALPNLNGYSVINAYPVVDSTKMYYIEERPYEGYYPGSKNYGKKQDELLNKAYEKNTLLFLNSFLGETGQRIWTMMNDYYTMSGYSYVAPETEWTKKRLFIDEWEGISFYLPEPLNRISNDVVEKYGFIVINNNEVSNTGDYLLTIKTEKQIIDIQYEPDSLLSGPWAGYSVQFTTIEK